jgi:hypothetical protein
VPRPARLGRREAADAAFLHRLEPASRGVSGLLVGGAGAPAQNESLLKKVSAISGWMAKKAPD